MSKVSVLTPVYNGGAFLKDCIESVLRQSHTDWEYVLVNNCSTDDTLQIAESYAAQDPRIRVVSNRVFVNADENHNIAFRLVAADSDFVKVVSADDWLAPECIEKLVRLAEGHPRVGLVGSYQDRGGEILWQGIPLDQQVIEGRLAARRALLEGVHVFGAPTSVLYRAELVRARPSFFPHTRPHADTDAAYELMKTHDLGFVHEVLSFDRVHPGRESTAVLSNQAGSLAYIEAVLKYGPVFLDPDERAARLAELENEYYDLLGRSLLRCRGPRFWNFHRAESRAIGLELRLSRVLSAAAMTALRELRSPDAALRKVWQYYSKRWRSR